MPGANGLPCRNVKNPLCGVNVASSALISAPITQPVAGSSGAFILSRSLVHCGPFQSAGGVRGKDFHVHRRRRRRGRRPAIRPQAEVGRTVLELRRRTRHGRDAHFDRGRQSRITERQIGPSCAVTAEGGEEPVSQPAQPQVTVLSSGPSFALPAGSSGRPPAPPS